MSTTFPTSKQSVPNPSSTDLLENATAELDHDYQHATINDTVEALQDKVGIDGSAVTTSHDYKLSGVTGSDKAVSKTGTETLTNKTLTSPTINVTSDATGDIYYRSSGGAFTRLPIGSNGNILQTGASGIPEWVTNPAAADASTTVKGVVEEATQAEYDARTAAGGTSARLFINPSTVRGILYHDYAASSSGNDTYAITVTPAPTAYTTGDVYVFEPDTANTGAATLNVNSLGAKTIKKKNDQDLETGDIEAGQVVQVAYDGTNFQMLSQLASNPLAYTNGATTRTGSAASGTQTIAHGLGKTPTRVVINASCIVTTGEPAATSNGIFSNSTTTTNYQSPDSGNGNTTFVAATDTTNIINMQRLSTGTTGSQVATCSVDSTNITLTWTKTGTSLANDVKISWEVSG